MVYELEIDAITGKIKEFERDDHDDDNKKTIDGRISVDKAKSIALGLTGGGEVKEFELDDDEYEIEIIAKGIEYEITIDSKTGEIKEFEKDDDDNYKKASDERVSADKAKSVALNLTGGGKITVFDYDDGEYEIEIMADGKEYEIEIDAKTGKVLEFEVDDED